jgi:transcription factor C subunit 6
MQADPPTPSRHSRRNVSNKKYIVDPFDGLDILSSDSEVSAEEADDNSSTDEEFTFDQGVEGIEDDAEFFSEKESENSRTGTPTEDGDVVFGGSDAHIPKPDGGQVKGPSDHPKRLPSTAAAVAVHTRGIAGASEYAAKEIYLSQMVGTADEDVLVYLQSRNLWMQDTTFPTRWLNARGEGGMAHFPGYTEAMRLNEGTKGWNWYYDRGGREAMIRSQDPQLLSISDGVKYLPQGQDAHRFLMGPYGAQKLFVVKVRGSAPIAPAWQGEHSAKPKAAQEPRRGWILNVGSPVQCLDWAPNQDGDVQYLAVATLHQPPPDHDDLGAFAPTQPFASSIQIWAFDVETKADEALISHRSPKLMQVICTDWGAIRKLQWCPSARIVRDAVDKGKISIGLLAGIWSDGHIRVLDIVVDKSLGSSSTFGKHNLAPKSYSILT